VILRYRRQRNSCFWRRIGIEIDNIPPTIWMSFPDFVDIYFVLVELRVNVFNKSRLVFIIRHNRHSAIQNPIFLWQFFHQSSDLFRALEIEKLILGLFELFKDVYILKRRTNIAGVVMNEEFVCLSEAEAHSPVELL
jgi:hypothetical protein